MKIKENKRKISGDRVKKIRKKKNKIIIAVEGDNKTEKIYFNNFDDGKKAYSISIARGNTTDPLSMVKRLDAEARKLELDLKNGDEAYCVFDVDTLPYKNKLIKEAKCYAENKNIKVITSAPSIELWFYLHYGYTTAFLSNEDVIKKLKQHVPDYQKNHDIYSLIKNNESEAIKRAKKLEKFQISNDKEIGSVEANPNTEMYIIVENLNKIGQ